MTPRTGRRSDGSKAPTTLLSVRLTAAELAVLDRDRGGLSRSDYVRRVLCPEGKP